jgi:hypothetical protein
MDLKPVRRGEDSFSSGGALLITRHTAMMTLNSGFSPVHLQPVASSVHRFRESQFKHLYSILCAAGSLVSMYITHK